MSDLSKLKYLYMVLEESMRLYPPGFIIRREVVEDITIDDYLIKKGSMVMVSPWVTHRHKSYWENPEAFIPERMERSEKAKRHSYTFFPFGGGKRTCIGNNFAMLEMAAIIVSIIQNYELGEASDKSIKPAMGTTLNSESPIKLTIRKRT